MRFHQRSAALVLGAAATLALSIPLAGMAGASTKSTVTKSATPPPAVCAAANKVLSGDSGFLAFLDAAKIRSYITASQNKVLLGDIGSIKASIDADFKKACGI